MKTILCVLLFLSFNVQAIEAGFFDNQYPSFQNYQELVFSKIKTYFETLQANSLIYSSSNNIKQYRINDVDNEDLVSITSTIIRLHSPNKITERILYSIENGEVFEVVIEKRGVNIINSLDNDLLSFHFTISPNDEYYQITIPSLQIQLNQTHQSSGMKSFLNIGFMDFILKIESNYQEHQAQQSYFYFIKEMTNPQASLTVKVVENKATWNMLEFSHISSQSGVVTPGQFVDGLNSGAELLTVASEVMFKFLNKGGFPKLLKDN